MSHDRYGLGRVIGVEGDVAVLVEFGDRQAFSLVYERYSSAVLSYLYRMLGNVERAHARLPGRVGWSNAMELLLTGERVDAPTARRRKFSSSRPA